MTNSYALLNCQLVHIFWKFLNSYTWLHLHWELIIIWLDTLTQNFIAALVLKHAYIYVLFCVTMHYFNWIEKCISNSCLCNIVQQCIQILHPTDTSKTFFHNSQWALWAYSDCFGYDASAEHDNCTGDCCIVKAYTTISLLFSDDTMNLPLYIDLHSNLYVV